MTTSPREARLALWIYAFYGLMALSGLAMILWRRCSWQFDPLSWPGGEPLRHLLMTALLVAAVHFGARLWLRWSARARRCAGMLRESFGWAGRREVLLLALLSGLGEELLFRGWLLPEIGLFWSSLVFGLVHVPPHRDWLFWPVFATVVGLLLGALTLSSGTILWAVLAHAAINHLNLNLALGSRGRDRRAPW